jgi:hypothetical protein
MDLIFAVNVHANGARLQDNGTNSIKLPRSDGVLIEEISRVEAQIPIAASQSGREVKDAVAFNAPELTSLATADGRVKHNGRTKQ